mgnify:CR=1 FL=1
MTLEHINQELQTLKEKKNYRSLPPVSYTHLTLPTTSRV